MQKTIRQITILIIGMLISISASAIDSAYRNEKVIVFVSFSMPKDSLKGWVTEAKKIHAPIVMRGLVNNSFKETVAQLKDLFGLSASGILLDPNVFKKYRIDKVPAVVVTNGDKYDVVYGDVHLAYALKEIIRQHDGLSGLAEVSLKLLGDRQNG